MINKLTFRPEVPFYISQLRQPGDYSRERQQTVRTKIATGEDSQERNRETITSSDRRLENEK